MGSKSIIAIVIILVVVIVFGVILSLRGPKTGTNSKNKAVPIIATKTTVEVNDITADPLVYDGLSVEVESGVSEWVTKKSFKVSTGGGAFGSAGSQLLVIRKDPFSLPQADSGKQLGLGEKVRVHLKGRVAIINKDQLAKELGVNLDNEDFKRLDDNDLTSWTLGPVLLLDSVEKI